MKLTDEQQHILASSGNIKINAVAGSGKTTTLVEYARKRPSSTRILYLAFNRSVRLEAQHKFSTAGLSNVQVHTAHSLAYRSVVPRFGYQVCLGYKPHELIEQLKLSADFEGGYGTHLLANHVMAYAALFCNHVSRKVIEVDYLQTVGEPKARSFVKNHYDRLLQATRQLLALMDKGALPITHEFYLKKFQLMNPQLPFDLILFDEGQDASPVMLDIFLAQQADKVIVGDVYQQIYGWRHAVNALQQVDFKEYSLSKSFRFGPDVAALALECLQWKKLLNTFKPLAIEGCGKTGAIKTRAVVARSNLYLLRAAIALITTNRSIKRIYFEGNLNSYTYAAEGASIYDVLNLYLDNRGLVRDKLIGSMQSFEQLKEYAEQAADMELSMLIEIVEEYGSDIPRHLKRMREMHVDDENRHRADMVFSTVHRCKGMEYDEVRLESDFITESRIRKLLDNKDVLDCDIGRLDEEINLLYVALTRARSSLIVPEELFPLHEAAKRTPVRLTPVPGQPRDSAKKRASTLQQQREQHAQAYAPWSEEEELQLGQLAVQGVSVNDMSKKLLRRCSAIRSRLKKLGLTEQHLHACRQQRSARRHQTQRPEGHQPIHPLD